MSVCVTAGSFYPRRVRVLWSDMIELEEDKPYHLRENVTGAENGECCFRFRFGGQEAEFFFGVRDEDVISPFQEDNEDLWQGDAVEVFLSPDGNPEHYFELEVSPFGVRFWGEVTFAGGEKRLKKVPPPFEAEVVRTEAGYAVQIKLPLSAMQGYDRRAVMLNAFRVDKHLDGDQDLYALNPTLCESFHKPQKFIKVQEKE